MIPAILTNKRKAPNPNGSFVVSVTCPSCLHTETVAFSGWSAVLCRVCCKELRRTPYRRGAYLCLVIAQVFVDIASRLMLAGEWDELDSVDAADLMVLTGDIKVDEARDLALLRVGLRPVFHTEWGVDSGHVEARWADEACELWSFAWDIVTACGPASLLMPATAMNRAVYERGER